jgi:hypothetical protein
MIVYEKHGPAVDISYSLSFNSSMTHIDISAGKTSRRSRRGQQSHVSASSGNSENRQNIMRAAFLNVKPLQRKPKLAEEKINDLKSMFKYMDPIDIAFYETILK